VTRSLIGPFFYRTAGVHSCATDEDQVRL
jgi:hypothetical protein